MSATKRTDPFHSQVGGITILVALMLLVLLTIAAVGMSRNSFREVVTSGFSRQGAMTRNVADSGIEWAIHWIHGENGTVATGNALQFTQLKNGLLVNDKVLSGRAKGLNASDFNNPPDYTPGGALQPEFSLAGPSGVAQGFTLGLTLMGKLAQDYNSVTVGGQTYNPASGNTSGGGDTRPDLWAVRSDAQVVQGATTFIHAKEVWISTPIQ